MLLFLVSQLKMHLIIALTAQSDTSTFPR